jgi:hypothetical protein
VETLTLDLAPLNLFFICFVLSANPNPDFFFYAGRWCLTLRPPLLVARWQGRQSALAHRRGELPELQGGAGASLPSPRRLG